MTTAKEPLTRAKSSSFFRSVVSKLKLGHPIRMVIPSDEPERGASPDSSSSRCEFTFSDGRQCRSQRAQFCLHHSSKKQTGVGDEVAPDAALVGLCADLTTATNINRALAQTFLLMAQGRISRKDAVAFGYLSQLLLQTVPGIRSEFVSSFGYSQWEKRLKHSLDPNSDEDPEPSSGGNGQSEPADIEDSYDDEHESDESPVPEHVMESLLRRGLALVDRKYDFTPEGRHEAKKLALDLELLKPAPAKPPRDHFGRVVDLVRRFRDAEERNSGAAPQPPPNVNMLGQPIPPVVVTWAESPASKSAAPKPEFEPKLPSASEPASNVQLPSLQEAGPTRYATSARRKPRRKTAASPSPQYEQPLQTEFPSESGPQNVPREGHATDWYAPPAWSGTRRPDPFPSHQEKLKRKFGGMSNSKFRRLQHHNSRSL